MSTDLIRYDLLVQDALRSVVRRVLTDTARDGVPGEHHYYVSFRTTAPGVRISNRLREKYPDEMTIVLQHQFWDLGVTEHTFEVGLAFGGIPERLLVPFEAVTGFFDPSVQFGLKFEVAGGTSLNDSEVAHSPSDNEIRAPLSGNGKDRPISSIGAKAESAKPQKAKFETPSEVNPQTKPESVPALTNDSATKLPAALPQPAQKPGSANGVSEPRPGVSEEKEAASPKTAEVVSLDSFRKKN